MLLAKKLLKYFNTTNQRYFILDTKRKLLEIQLKDRMYLLFQVVYSILICWELTFSLQYGAETFDDKQERYIRRFNLHGKQYRNNLILKKIKNAWRKNAICMGW